VNHPSKEPSPYLRVRIPPDGRRAALWTHLTPYLQQYVKPTDAVLELGAGYCYFINNVSAARRVAVDHASDLIEWAGPGVEAHATDAIEYLDRLPTGEFDFVMASNFLEHFGWPDLERMMDLIIRALKPGGRLALIQPNFRLAPGRYFDDYTHRTAFTDVSLSDWLVSKGLHIKKVEARFLPLTIKSGIGHLSGLIPLYLRLPWRPLAGQMFVLAEK
jgi:SAM-dependent methyltransferase